MLIYGMNTIYRIREEKFQERRMTGDSETFNPTPKLSTAQKFDRFKSEASPSTTGEMSTVTYRARPRCTRVASN